MVERVWRLEQLESNLRTFICYQMSLNTLEWEGSTQEVLDEWHDEPGSLVEWPMQCGYRLSLFSNNAHHQRGRPMIWDGGDEDAKKNS